MNNREKLKKTKAPKLSADDAFALLMDEWVPWTCGTDVPLSWDPKDLKQCEKNCLRANYKSGFFTKKQYSKALKKMNDKFNKEGLNEKNTNNM
jgi:hypothetical protein